MKQCLKKTLQLLDVIFNLWKIWKEKIKIVLNKTNSNGLSEDVFTEVCKLQVIANIKQDKQEFFESYEEILEILKYIPKKNLLEFLGQEKNKILMRIKEKTTSNKIMGKEKIGNSMLPKEPLKN